MFAANYPRSKKGWVVFPADADIRRQLFPLDAMEHPAKNNLYEMTAIIDYLYKPNELILDPMAGTGSTMLAAIKGCRVICIDCSPTYYEMLERSKFHMLMQNPDADITVLEGDCKDFLPIPVDHVVFSPPFVDYFKKKAMDDTLRTMVGSEDEYFMGFSQGKGNIGMMPEFLHMQAMERIFKLCAQSVPVGGTVTIITRDCIEQGKRVYLSKKYIGSARRAGLELKEAFKREVPRSGLDNINLAKGVPMIDDEDILILWRTK